MTADEIKAKWSNSGKDASEAGTAMHLAIEMHHNGAEHLIPEEIKETPEWKYFLNYWNDFGHELEPYRTEWEVFSEPHKLAGSIDMIYRRKSDGKFIIYDWKRSKEIKTTNTFENGYAPLGHLPNCNYWHYTLQLNVYKWFLETFYGLEVAELYLIILHPDNTNYRRLRLNILPDEVQEMLGQSIKAFVERDTDLALEIIGRDKLVDAEYKETVRDVEAAIVSDPATTGRELHLLTVAKALERAGDHVKNIAEEVFFLFKGQDIRHVKVRGNE
jgi:hypothetical protein